jgi:ATP-dependent helicase/nuclease subunit A
LLTVVGDEKQAIYGFRRADAAVFRRFRDRILKESGSEVLLARTFRAHSKLVARLNAVFAAVLGDLHQALEAHRVDPPHAGPHVGVYTVEAEGRVSKVLRQRAEATFIARLLRRMMDDSMPVHDRSSGALRPIQPGDVALLSRAWEPLEVYGEALAATGLPAVHAGGGNLLETREAKDGLALLRFLDDPADDIALLALLRGRSSRSTTAPCTRSPSKVSAQRPGGIRCARSQTSASVGRVRYSQSSSRRGVSSNRARCWDSRIASPATPPL